MSMPVSAEGFFKPPKSRSETKAATTNHAARAILAAEAATRDAKTKKLRALRLAEEKRLARRDKIKAAAEKK